MRKRWGPALGSPRLFFTAVASSSTRLAASPAKPLPPFCPAGPGSIGRWLAREFCLETAGACCHCLGALRATGEKTGSGAAKWVGSIGGKPKSSVFDMDLNTDTIRGDWLRPRLTGNIRSVWQLASTAASRSQNRGLRISHGLQTPNAQLHLTSPVSGSISCRHFSDGLRPSPQ
jgi:hypothetical protein